MGLVYLYVFGSPIGFTAYSWLLKNATPSMVATYAYVNPVVAVILGWAITGPDNMGTLRKKSKGKRKGGERPRSKEMFSPFAF
jgi:hypothetical protein